jgi:TatD DNase family protein
MLIDTHFHLDLMENMQALIQDFRSSDIGVMAVGTTPQAFEREIQFCSGVSNIKVGLGFHPQIVKERAQEIDLLLSLIPAAGLIGEVGLDYNSAYASSMEQQLSCFRKAAKTCADYGNKILSIHSAKAAGKTIDELEIAGTFRSCVCIFHWFTGTGTELKRAVKNGAYFSINPKMLRTKSGQEIIKTIPEQSILLETDAPFTAKYESAEQLKQDLIFLVDKISRLRNQDMVDTIERNSTQVFGYYRYQQQLLYSPQKPPN